MRKVGVAEAARFMRSKGLGDYGLDDENAFPGGVEGNNGSPYSEDVVFNGTVKGSVSTVKEFAAAAIAQEAAAPVGPPKEEFENGIVSALLPFDLNATGGQIINTNPKRTYLVIQNQNAAGGANLFFNLGNTAAVSSGVLLQPLEAVIFDVKCPSDSVFVFCAGVCHGIVLQGSQNVLQGL